MSQKTKKRFINPRNILAFLFQEERRSSVLLVVSAIAALVIANSSWSDTYFSFFDQVFRFGAVSLDLKHWINEGLMVFFFLVVGLEIKRELVDGELRTMRKAMFPLAAAVGGMLVPALLFSLFNPYQPQNSGWAVPMATDIAIAAGVLALLGRSVPKSLRVFLLSLAIIDDIGSIAVISIFYSRPTNTLALLIAVLLGLALFMANKNRYWPAVILVLGTCIWYFLLLAGVSGTLAGIIVAFAMPLNARRAGTHRLQAAETVEDILIPFTSFLIVPLFVFANAGLRFSGISLSSGNGKMVFIGVTCGLLIGKPLGIFIASWLAAALRIAHKPKSIGWVHIAGVGILAGTGFTVSLLITNLAYDDNYALQKAAVAGIFAASVAASAIGLGVLRRTARG